MHDQKAWSKSNQATKATINQSEILEVSSCNAHNIQPRATGKHNTTTMSDTEDDYLLTGHVARKLQKVGAQKLMKLFEDKTIQPTDKPSDVRGRDILFSRTLPTSSFARSSTS
jgi:hypothetical protein